MNKPCDNRTFIFDTGGVRRAELLRRLKAYARRNGLAYSFDPGKGKGSHGRVTVGNRFTTVKMGEFGPGLFRKVLTDLDIDKEEL